MLDHLRCSKVLLLRAYSAIIPSSSSGFKSYVKYILRSCSARRYSSLDYAPAAGAPGEGKTTVTIHNTEEENILLINAYNSWGFRLNTGFFVLGPIVIFPKTVLQWNIENTESVNEASLSLFDVIDPQVDVLVIGLGDESKERETFLAKYFTLKKINFEILPTYQACATFNFLNIERRYVAAAMIPPESIRSPESNRMKIISERKKLLNE